MTTPENPDPTEPDSTQPDPTPPAEPGFAEVDPGPQPVSAAAGAGGGVPAGDDTPTTEVAAGDLFADDPPATGAMPDVPASDIPASGVPVSDIPASDELPGAGDVPAETTTANGTSAGSAWVSSATPPWQRSTAPAPPPSQASRTFDPPTVTLRLDQAEPDGTVTPQPEESRRRFSNTYGFSQGVGPGRAGTSSRYGHSVSQPTGGHGGRGVGQDSQPTVRIGGSLYSEPPPAASTAPPPSAASRVRSTPRIPRRASLQLRYLEPWSVLKISLVLSVAGFLAWMVAVGILYGVLEGMGVWDQLNGTYSDLTSVNDPQAGQPLISAGGVFGVATLIGLVNIVLVTAMCTVGSFIYNVSADLAGGIEVTLSERD